MKKLYYCLGLIIGIQTTFYGQFEVPAPQNIENRDVISLNGHWQYFVDRYEAFFYDFVRTPFDESELWKTDFAALDAVAKDKSDRLEYGFQDADSLMVPGDWNSQRERLFYYEGSIWYRKKVEKPRITENEKVLLHFAAANYRTDVYVNGQKAGMHEGGFTPFAFDVSTLMTDGTNSIVVRVDNKRHKEAVPTDVTDWWNYGGITRDVNLVILPKTYIENYELQLNPANSKEVRGFIKLSSPTATSIHITNRELEVDVTLESEGSDLIPFKIPVSDQLIRWSLENPKRYLFTLTTKTDTLNDLIGLRTITTMGNQILLNDKPIFLKGISVHEENSEKGGRATTKEDALRLIKSAEVLGANFMRLAHYPHSTYMSQLADERGMLLWEEIPVYWTIDWENEDTYTNAERQLRELINRDRNRASVIIWSLANETPTTAPRLSFLKRLANTTRELDDTRLLSAALFKQKLTDGTYTITDPFSEFTDLVSFNTYLGWYEGLPEVIDSATFVFSSNKPVIVSEFGAGAKAGFHADALTRWSEEFQDDVYKRTVSLLDRIPNLAGVSPWILYDFRSPRRNLPDIQDGWNRKGIIGETGIYKKAFYTLRDYYKTKD